jgi:hypothetical protein
MDTNMADVGQVPADVSSMPVLEPATVPTVDGWIESLMACKQLAEVDVQRLCEKVKSLSGAVASVGCEHMAAQLTGRVPHRVKVLILT